MNKGPTVLYRTFNRTSQYTCIPSVFDDKGGSFVVTFAVEGVMTSVCGILRGHDNPRITCTVKGQ